MIRYVIDQEDGQTVHTDYTDTNIFKERRLKTMYWAGGISTLYNELYEDNLRKEINECSSTPREIKDQRIL